MLICKQVVLLFTANQFHMTAKKKSTRALRSPKKSTRQLAPKITSRSLVATVTSTSAAAEMEVTFISGIGQLTVSLFRNGVLINLQSVSSSSKIFLSDVQRGDMISTTGVCTGKAEVKINVPTTPASPQNFDAGPIFFAFVVL